MNNLSKAVANVGMAIIMLVAGAACDAGKSTTIVNKSENLYQKIKYSGRIIFMESGKGIEHISDGGYLEFEKNGCSFEARENGHGKISYKFDGGSAVTELDLQQREFVAKAVGEIIRSKAKLK